MHVQRGVDVMQQPRGMRLDLREAIAADDDHLLEPRIVQRADLVVAGCAILESILAIWPASRLGVADRGIREGILRSLMATGVRREGGPLPAATTGERT